MMKFKRVVDIGGAHGDEYNQFKVGESISFGWPILLRL
jgi:hypothetical protein